MGHEIFEQQCSACHGEKGEGALADRLVGGQGTLATAKPIKTVGSYWPYATTLFDYVRRAMPHNAPQSLSNDEVYAVSAYILHLNGVIPADAALDAKSLPAIKMPNRTTSSATPALMSNDPASFSLDRSLSGCAATCATKGYTLRSYEDRSMTFAAMTRKLVSVVHPPSPSMVILLSRSATREELRLMCGIFDEVIVENEPSLFSTDQSASPPSKYPVRHSNAVARSDRKTARR